MKQWVVQFIVGRRPSGVDDCDLDWRTIKGESYTGADGEVRAWEACDMYDLDFDGRLTHRAVEVEVDEVVMAKPIVKAPVVHRDVKPAAQQKAAVMSNSLAASIQKLKLPRLEGSPKPAKVTRQLAEHRARQRIETNSERLKSGLASGVAFDLLLPIVELLELDLETLGGTQLAAAFRANFATVRQQVEGKRGLRVVK